MFKPLLTFLLLAGCAENSEYLLANPATAMPLEKPSAAISEPFDPEFAAAEIFSARCAMCHGKSGNGNARLGRKLGARNITSADWQRSRTDAQIEAAIRDGLPDTRMKAFGAMGTDRQFAELVVLIRSMAEAQALDAR